MLVLDGNNPRFPWEPSTTMLTYRLEGTTEASASYRDGHHHPGPPKTSPLSATTGASAAHIFTRPGEHPKVLYVADLHVPAGRVARGGGLELPRRL